MKEKELNQPQKTEINRALPILDLKAGPLENEYRTFLQHITIFAHGEYPNICTCHIINC